MYFCNCEACEIKKRGIKSKILCARINIKIEKINAVSRKMKFKFSCESYEDFNALFDFDTRSEIK